MINSEELIFTIFEDYDPQIPCESKIEIETIIHKGHEVAPAELKVTIALSTLGNIELSFYFYSEDEWGSIDDSISFPIKDTLGLKDSENMLCKALEQFECKNLLFISERQLICD